MKKVILHSLRSALLLISATAIAVAQQAGTLDVPRTISYQGLLTSGDGTPLPNGVYDITVTLFADETGSQEIWQNTYSTSVLNGLFNLHLGAGDAPLPDPSQMNRPLWVGTSVNGTGQMTPLTPLTSSPYALNLPDKAVTTNKLADGAVTAEKVEMDYISEVQIDGQKISAKGTVLNLVSTPNVPLNYDETTRSVTIGKPAAQTGDKEKASSIQGNPDQVWSTAGDGWDIAAGGVYVVGTNPPDVLGPLTAGVNFNLTTGTGLVMVYQPSTTGGAFDNIVGGNGNAISAASDASVIAGGGGVGAVSNNIVGGSNKSAIGGGESNAIGLVGPPAVPVNYSVVAGGQTNVITGGGHSTISGGANNTITAPLATIGGGGNHVITGPEGTIAGGHVNRVDMYVGTIGGGHNNTVAVGGDAGFIGGGRNNTVNAPVTTIAGGWMNTVTGPEGTIAGGHNNRVDSYVGAITGGHDNNITTTSEAGTIGGGRNNTVNARLGTIPGGDYLLTNNSYAQSAMGFANAPRGAVGFRPAPAGLTNDPLFMIGNGDLSTLPIIARANAFEVSYNGHSVVSDNNGSGGAFGGGPFRSAVTGGTYEDNVIYGWAEVNGNGTLACADFGIASVAHVAGTGVYRFTLNITQPDGITPVFISCGAVVATLGTGMNPPTVMPGTIPAGVACAYIRTSNILNNVFDVYITQFNPATGNCDMGVDQPFKFHVTGRP